MWPRVPHTMTARWSGIAPLFPAYEASWVKTRPAPFYLPDIETAARAPRSPQRLAGESLPDMIGVGVLAELRDLVAVEPYVPVIAVGVLAAIGGGRIGSALNCHL